MSEFSEKLNFFIENICPKKDVIDCENCPGGHYIGLGCQHPEHPSVKRDVDYIKEKSERGCPRQG